MSREAMQMAKEVDETDTAILRALVKNARASYREVASEIGVAVGTVQHRMQKMEEKGILLGFRPIIDYGKLGFEVDAIIALETPRDKTVEIDKILEKHKNVKSIYHTTGDTDVFIRVQFKTAQELYDFLMKELTDQYVKRSKTYIVMAKHKNYGTLLLKGE